jgi:hypothetical protein
VIVIADRTADPAACAADLLAQAEHGPDSEALLLTTDAGLSDRVANLVVNHVNVTVELVDSLDKALARSEAFAPEHLELHVADPDALLERVRNAGSVFVGGSAVVGDYAAGATHVLPTGGLARSSGGLGLESFLKPLQIVRATPAGVAAAAEVVGPIARVEGLPLHAAAVEYAVAAGKDVAPTPGGRRTRARQRRAACLCRHCPTASPRTPGLRRPPPSRAAWPARRAGAEVRPETPPRGRAAGTLAESFAPERVSRRLYRDLREAAGTSAATSWDRWWSAPAPTTDPALRAHLPGAGCGGDRRTDHAPTARDAARRRGDHRRSRQRRPDLALQPEQPDGETTPAPACPLALASRRRIVVDEAYVEFGPTRSCPSSPDTNLIAVRPVEGVRLRRRSVGYAVAAPATAALLEDGGHRRRRSAAAHRRRALRTLASTSSLRSPSGSACALPWSPPAGMLPWPPATSCGCRPTSRWASASSPRA